MLFFNFSEYFLRLLLFYCPPFLLFFFSSRLNLFHTDFSPVRFTLEVQGSYFYFENREQEVTSGL